MKRLNLENMKDNDVRINFEAVQDEINGQIILNGNWKHYEVTLSEAATDYPFKHNLNFTPKDVIVTASTDKATTSIDLDNSEKYVYITTDKACTIRFFLGSYQDRRRDF